MPIPLPPPQPRLVRRAVDRPNLLEELRKELVSLLHMGHIKPGDRLPSIRALAREKKLDHRIVANAYRSLADEGLVEVRGRSGVVAAEVHRLREEPKVSEKATWVASMLNEAWQKKLSQKELAMLMSRCLDSSNLCCVCVESNRDQMVAYTSEIESVAGITAVPLYLGSEEGDEMGSDRDLEGLRHILAKADLVVTTQYHLNSVRSLLGSSRVPLVVIRIDPELASAVREQVQGPGLIIVATTNEFAARMRAMYAEKGGADNIELILASDAEAVAAIDRSRPVLLTRAARQLLPELGDITMVFPHSPTMAPDTIEELSQAIVSANLTRMSA